MAENKTKNTPEIKQQPATVAKSKPKMTPFGRQMLVLACVALVCGLLLAGVKLLVGDLGGGGLAGDYAKIYAVEGVDLEYTPVPAQYFNEVSAVGTSATITAIGRIDVSDGAVILHITAIKDTRINLTLYIAVKDGVIKDIYVDSMGNTWLGTASPPIEYNSRTKKINISSIKLPSSGTSQTQETLVEVLQFARDIAV